MSITVESGPSTKIRPRRVAAGNHAELKQTIAVLKPGQWFRVPGTKGQTGKQLRGVLSVITRTKNDLEFGKEIFAAEAEDGSGLIVKRAGEYTPEATRRRATVL